MVEKYYIKTGSIVYGETPRGIAYHADLYSTDSDELQGAVCNDGNGGGTYFRPSYAEGANPASFAEVEREANHRCEQTENYYEKLMDIAEGI